MGKKAIFSVWDVAGHESAKPISANCQRFGHEGSGTSCIIPFAWKAGREYKLRVWVLDSNSAGQNWGAWVVDYLTGEETLIGAVTLMNTGGRQGYGGLTGNTTSVLEFYGSSGENEVACNELPDFGVTWNGPFSNDASQVPKSSRVAYRTGVGSHCPGAVQAVANAPFSVTAEVGRAEGPGGAEGADLWSRFAYAAYAETECLFNWGERHFGSAFDQGAFRHRRLSTSLFGFYLRDYRVNGRGHAMIADTLANRLLVGVPGGEMADLGDLDALKRTAGCKR